MTGEKTNHCHQFLIDIPADRVEEVFQAINDLGISQTPHERVAHLEFWKSDCHVLFGYDTGALVESINRLLDEHGLTPRITGNQDDWSLERRTEFLEMAASRSGWSSERTGEPHWSGDPEGKLRRVTQDYPGLFEESEARR